MGGSFLLMKYFADGSRESVFMHEAVTLPQAKSCAQKYKGNCVAYEIYRAQTNIIPNTKVEVNKEDIVTEK